MGWRGPPLLEEVPVKEPRRGMHLYVCGTRRRRLKTKPPDEDTALPLITPWQKHYIIAIVLLVIILPYP